MKTTIFYWAFQNFEERTGYAHKQEIPVEDTFKVAEAIQEKTGLNVMIQVLESGNKVLYIDDKRFTVR